VSKIQDERTQQQVLGPGEILGPQQELHQTSLCWQTMRQRYKVARHDIVLVGAGIKLDAVYFTSVCSGEL